MYIEVRFLSKQIKNTFKSFEQKSLKTMVIL